MAMCNFLISLIPSLREARDDWNAVSIRVNNITSLVNRLKKTVFYKSRHGSVVTMGGHANNYSPLLFKQPFSTSLSVVYYLFVLNLPTDIYP